MERVSVMPDWLYQRYRPFCDRLIPALGMAFLFVLTDQVVGAFSREWRLFIAGGVLVAGLVKPIVGYVLFVLVLAYPLYSISIYIAALALTVLSLLAFFPTRYLTAIILVIAIPLLALYRVALIVPLLAGLWWAEWGGVLAGLGSALWLKVFVGMCGMTPDLTQLGGQSLAVHQLVTRFHTANSLQTLLWLAEPFVPGLVESPTPDTRTLLLHIFEVFGWGLAGYGVGLMRQRVLGSSRLNVALLASVSAGLLGLWLGSLVVPIALSLREPFVFSAPFVVECCWGGIMAMGIYRVSHYLTRPVVQPLRSRSERYRSPSYYLSSTGEGREEEAIESATQAWEHPQSRDDEQADIIMIELD